MAADDDTPITKAILDEVVDKLVKLIGDNGRKLDTDMADFWQELRLLSTSIKNVQTQVLDRQGRFDTDASSASGPSLAPTHKLRFPKFNGSDDPITWLHKGEQFFRAYGTPDHLKVSTAAFYLQDAASQWYYRLEQNQGIPTWTQFVDGINRCFGPPLRSNPLGELTHLRHTTTVDEYQDKFLVLLVRCEGVTELQQIAIFSVGLRQPLSTDVELVKPTTLEEAMALACAFERRQAAPTELPAAGSRLPSRPSQRASTPPSKTPPPTGVSGSTPASSGAPTKPATTPDRRFKRLSPEEMAQCRLDGLCFNCPEKFSRDHLKHCTGKGIYLLELSPDDDSPAGSESDDDLQISVAAITGIQANATLQLVAHIRDAPATALVDSSSTHSFIDESLAHCLGLIPGPRPGLSVGVANGDRVASSGLCKAVRLVIDKEEFTVDLFVIPLGGLGIVLGCDWLRSLGPILWDFTNLAMVF